MGKKTVREYSLNWQTPEDPRQHELQYANIMPSAGLSAPAISAQDVGRGFSHYAIKKKKKSSLFR